MKKTKIIIGVLALIMAFALVGCKNNTVEDKTDLAITFNNKVISSEGPHGGSGELSMAKVLGIINENEIENQANVNEYEEVDGRYKFKQDAESPAISLTPGIIVFYGTKEELGNTVIVQGNDGVDIWYSGVTLSSFSIYDYVSKGNKILAIVDLSKNRKVSQVSAYPPIHNIQEKNFQNNRKRKTR